VATETQNPRSFLITDDDPIIVSLLEQLLVQRGARHVYIANDGLMALDILKDTSKQVDVMTLDLNMPNMDGVTFLSKAASIGYKGAIYLVSGESRSIINSARQLARLLGLNCIGTFSKPIDFDKVVDKITSKHAAYTGIVAALNIDQRELEYGLAHNQLTAFYQPKINTHSGNIVGAEALARMVRTDGTIIPAGEMVKIAEETGLIRDLTHQIAQCAVFDYRELEEQFDEGFTVSFNVSSDLLTDVLFCEQISALVKDAQLDPSSFILELTETKIPSDVGVALEGLTRLRLQGFGLAIDDFGTGFSNMEALRLFPFTELKVDQQFMLNARHDTFAWACVETSVKLARQLGLNIVAEGIESEFELALAKAHAIDELQGYLFAKPMPKDQFIAYAKNHSGIEIEQSIKTSGVLV